MQGWTSSPYGGAIHAVIKGRHDSTTCHWYLETNSGRRRSIAVVHQEYVRVTAVVMMWNCNGKTVEVITDPRAACSFYETLLSHRNQYELCATGRAATRDDPTPTATPEDVEAQKQYRSFCRQVAGARVFFDTTEMKFVNESAIRESG